MKKVPLGSAIELPSYIKNSKSMYSLTNNYRGKPYKDNDCFFRCLSLHQGALISGLEKLTKKLKTEFEEHIGEKLDNGITLDHIPAVEIKYQVAINILSLKEDGSADVVYLSRLDFKPMYINLYEKHCSYIHNYEKFAKKFSCYECDRTFNQSTHLKRHAKVCCTEVEEVYIGGKFKTNDTVFERLDRVGIKVQEEDRYYKYVSTYDYEAIQEPNNQIIQGRIMRNVHTPAIYIAGI